MTIAIKARRLIDGTGHPPMEKAVILIEGDKIAEIGQVETIIIPTGAEILDLSEQTVMPGLIDAHGHVSLDMSRGDVEAQLRDTEIPRVLRATRLLRLNLKAGVTTMRAVGDSRNYIDVACKQAIEAKVIPGPRLLVATKPIHATSGHGLGAGADGIDEIRKAVRTNLKAGADLTKLMVTGGVSSRVMGPYDYSYSKEEIATAVEETHRAGKRVAAHAHGGPGLRFCLEAGVDTIEHGAFIDDGDIELFLQTEAWLVGTFGILCHPDGLERAFSQVPFIQKKVFQAREQVADSFLKAVKAGVKYTLGTDSMQGLLGYELECVVRFGLTEMEAIVAATGSAAEACGLADQVGTLEPGKQADIISVRGNPLEDITVVRDVGLVMKGGARCDYISLQ